MYNIMWEMLGAAGGQAVADMLKPALTGVLSGLPLTGGINLDNVVEASVRDGAKAAIVNMWGK